MYFSQEPSSFIVQRGVQHFQEKTAVSLNRVKVTEERKQAGQINNAGGGEEKISVHSGREEKKQERRGREKKE